MNVKFLLSMAIAALTLGACGDMATLPVDAGIGPQPVLPAPQQTLLPTVNIAPAVGWPAGKTPQAAPGTRVAAFASGLDHPRWLHVLPNGDVLVAESNAPPKGEGNSGIKAWVAGLVMKRAGAAVPSANRITLLRDTDGDGIADLRTALLEGLNSPFGMALAGDQLYVANADAVLRFPLCDGRHAHHCAGHQAAGGSARRSAQPPLGPRT
jgi:glucose/arabinose dehydrogenase